MNNSSTPSSRLLIAVATMVVLTGMTLAISYALLTPSNSQAVRTISHSPKDIHGKENGYAKAPVPPPEYFRGLPDPQLVLLLSGQTYGYLQPCGCSRPQLGGLERRFDLMKRLREKGWPVSVADLGDLAPKEINEQGRLKFETALQILHDMRAAGLGMGFSEMSVPLDLALALGLNYQPPKVLAANFNDKEQFPGMFQGWTTDEPRLEGRSDLQPLKVGYVGLVGESVSRKAKERDPMLAFDPVEEVLSKALPEIEAQKPDLLVLLFQGSREEARQLAPKHPQFRVIMTLDHVEEPSALPETIGDTMLVSIGWKGRYVGLVGVFREASEKLKLHYQLADLSEFYELPDDQTNAARERMKEYVLRVHDGDFLSEEKYHRTKHRVQLEFPEATYVGSEACKNCHRNAYESWKKSSHSHAYETLVEHGRPRVKMTPHEPGQPSRWVGRQYDPDCVKCHTTGFDYQGGFVSEVKTPLLLGNGCENCHGPASLHVATATEKSCDRKYSKPLFLSAAQVERDCRRCHDGDNDPKFDFQQNWEKIRHGF